MLTLQAHEKRKLSVDVIDEELIEELIEELQTQDNWNLVDGSWQFIKNDYVDAIYDFTISCTDLALNESYADVKNCEFVVDDQHQLTLKWFTNKV